MNQQNQQPEKQNEEHRWDQELYKKGLHCDLDQYEMLKRCSDKNDLTEWNEWRRKYPKEEILLEGVKLHGIQLMQVKGYNFVGIKLESAKLKRANLRNALLADANLESASFIESNLEGAEFLFANLKNAYIYKTNLKGANFHMAIMDNTTTLWECKVDHKTDFEGVALNDIRIDPSTKQLLEYNIRRKNWEEWYQKGEKWQCILKRLFIRTFWIISDYGISTKRIISTFFGLAFVFVLLYRLFPSFVMVYGNVGDIRDFWHALYFSVVTMTTLGFGDIAANPDSWAGQTLLMAQVILGYVLLGALVTRFAVLFTAGGPAGKFSDEKSKKSKRKENLGTSE